MARFYILLKIPTVPYQSPGGRASSLSKDAQMYFSPADSPSSSGDTEAFPSQLRYIISSVSLHCLGASSQRDVQNTSQVSWSNVRTTLRSSSSILSTSQMTELLTLSLRLSPDTLQRKNLQTKDGKHTPSK